MIIAKSKEPFYKSMRDIFKCVQQISNYLADYICKRKTENNCSLEETTLLESFSRTMSVVSKSISYTVFVEEGFLRLHVKRF